MKKLHLLLLLYLVIFCTSAEAQSKSKPKPDSTTVEVIHDGITMALKRQGEGRIEIAYTEVPVQLRELGVKNGTVLVSGQWNTDEVMIGDAYIFTKECGALVYPVRGIVGIDNILTIIGPTPVNCEDRTLHWNEAAVLRFEPPRPFVQSKPRYEDKQKKRQSKEKSEPRKAERKQQPRRQQPTADPWQQQQYQWRW